MKLGELAKMAEDFTAKCIELNQNIEAQIEEVRLMNEEVDKLTQKVIVDIEEVRLIRKALGESDPIIQSMLFGPEAQECDFIERLKCVYKNDERED